MAVISRGFGSRRRESDPRLPPGQYLTEDFPVLSAGPTPRTDLSAWRFEIRSASDTLAAWTWDQVWDYTSEKKIEYLSLYDFGYRSIGCEPCTAIPALGTDARSGRWGGRKLECGIHTESKRAEG